ncbi:MAG TPA: SRPBCC family protein [Polyangiaceae bacterium]|jgi:carbon monoxide dehydrogenase subunit G|nr:SRPBCC family protein [Polyangiaceae bacterium]
MADTFRIARSATIAAPPERIAPHIQDFHAWEKWSPYEKLDPKMKKTFSGADRGVGAAYAWEGNSKAGAGSMTISAATSEKTTIALHFTKPMRAENTAEFTLMPDGTGTRVTWTMTGPKNLMMKLMGVFMNMDKMIGKAFDEGLGTLKELVEKSPN